MSDRPSPTIKMRVRRRARENCAIHTAAPAGGGLDAEGAAWDESRERRDGGAGKMARVQKVGEINQRLRKFVTC